MPRHEATGDSHLDLVVLCLGWSLLQEGEKNRQFSYILMLQ